LPWLLLVRDFAKGDEREQGGDLCLVFAEHASRQQLDLVDSSASQIVGSYLESRDRQLLYKLAQSAVCGRGAIAIISTFISSGIISLQMR